MHTRTRARTCSSILCPAEIGGERERNGIVLQQLSSCCISICVSVCSSVYSSGSGSLHIAMLKRCGSKSS